MQLKLSTKALTLIALPLLMDLCLIGMLFFALQRADFQSAQLNNSRTLVAKTDRIGRLVSDVAILTFRKKFGVGFDSPLEKLRNREIDEIQLELNSMQVLADKSPAKDSYIKAFDTARKAIIRFNQSFDDDSSGLLQALKCVNQLTPEVSKLTDLLNQASELETKTVESAVAREAQMRADIRNMISLGFVLNVIVAVALTVAFNRGVSRRLSALMDNASRIAKGEKLRAPLLGSDEIAELDRVLRNTAAELTEARKKERFLVDNMPVAIASLREDGTIDLVNPEMEELFLCSSAELQDMQLDDLLIIKDDVDLESGKPIELKLRGNEEKSVEIVLKEFGETRLIAMIDITQRLAIQRLRRQFVAMVSHDLRTPLTSVQASLEMVFSGIFGEISEAGKRQMSLAERSVDRMVFLINDLLDLEKLESASFKLNQCLVDIDDVIRRTLETSAARVQQSNVSILYQSKSLHCWADGDRIIQVLTNLIDNALKFSQTGQTITITADADQKSVLVRVIDQGRGIPKDMQGQIFERFVQVSKEDKNKQHGTGLGLAICKAIVHSHGGEIGVSSRHGQGSTFWFRLPIEEPMNGENSSS